jgi:hypothetical protein
MKPQALVKIFVTASVFFATVFPASVARAGGPYTDALSMCLVRSTTEADKILMVQWTFATMALHPEVESMSAVSFEKRSALNEGYANVIVRLLTEDCANETREAFRYEGASTFEASFMVLGQVAMRDLFSSPKVMESMEELGSYLDEDKFQAFLSEDGNEGEGQD